MKTQQIEVDSEWLKAVDTIAQTYGMTREQVLHKFLEIYTLTKLQSVAQRGFKSSP